MRILVVSNGYPPRGRWGTEFYTKELVHGLIARGHELFVLHPDRSGSRPRYELEEVEAEGVPVTLLHNPGDPLKRFESSYVDERVEARFGEVLDRIAPDACHFTYLLWGLSVRLPEVARRRGRESVVTLTDYGLFCHRAQMFDWRLTRCDGPKPPEVCARCIREPTPHDAGALGLLAKRALVRSLAAVGGLGLVVTRAETERREAIIRKAMESVGAWIAPTPGVEEVALRGGVPREKLTRLVYSFDEAPYEAARSTPPADPPRFGFPAQFAPHKGLSTLIRAAHLLERRAPDRPWELVLHGELDSGRHARYAERVLGSRDTRRIVIAPPFAPEEAPGVLSRFAALVLPSEWDENAPLSVLQARALGVPVLGSDVPGIACVVDDEAVGRLFPPGDAERLADEMERVLDLHPHRNPEPGLPLALDDHLAKIEALHARNLDRPS